MMIDTCVRLNLQIFQGGHSGIVCGLSLPRIVTFLSNLWGRRDIPGDGGSGGMSSSLLRSCVTHQGAGDDDGDSHPTPLTCPTESSSMYQQISWFTDTKGQTHIKWPQEQGLSIFNTSSSIYCKSRLKATCAFTFEIDFQKSYFFSSNCYVIIVSGHSLGTVSGNTIPSTVDIIFDISETSGEDRYAKCKSNVTR